MAAILCIVMFICCLLGLLLFHCSPLLCIIGTAASAILFTFDLFLFKEAKFKRILTPILTCVLIALCLFIPISPTGYGYYDYLNMLEKSFIMYKADRTDIKSKTLLKTLGKYYISDTGIRNIILGFRNIDEGHLLENVVYLELLRRSYKVNIGKTNEYEVDFVAENPNTIKYYQVTQSLQNDEVRTRELRSLENINDNYEKIILTMDKTINNDYNGIKVINIIDWLLLDE